MSASHSSCDFCGLPLPGAMWESSDAAAADASAEEYCCFGCRFAAAVTRERGETGAIRWTLTRLGLSIFLSMNVMAFTMALWTNDVYGGDDGGALAASLYGLFRYLCLLFSLPVLILLGGPLLDNAWQALRRGALSTDLLLLSGVVAAFVYSSVSVVRDAGPIYFEVACVILVMVTLGRWFEAAGRLRAGAALDELQRLLPDEVRVLRAGTEIRFATAKVAVGDQIRVLPGERFPVDGKLVRNSVTVDEQILTGESRPVTRHPGEPIHAGTLNLDGDVVVETTLPPGAGTLQRLIELVRQAREGKGHYQELADRLSAVVFPAVAAIALATFGWHWHTAGLEQGLMAGLAVVLVACPCALGLATPLAVWGALGCAARRQVLFRNGQALERLAAVRAIRFDKTGTLTTGTVRVTAFLTEESLDDAERAAILQRAARLAASSLHPFSRAIRTFANLPAAAECSSDVRQFPGRGISGRLDSSDGADVLGSRAFLEESDFALGNALKDLASQRENAGRSVAYFGRDGKVCAAFLFDEELRGSAVSAVTWCRDQGFDVAVLTGDRQASADRLAEELGVPVAAELLPEQKLAAVREVQNRIGPVAMVGDGINDAPALAASDVGVALGCGTDVSRDSAAVCLLGNDLARFTWAIGFARETVRVLRRSLIWAFAYNIGGIALAAAGWLNPALAALFMVLSSGLVIRSALSLQQLGDSGLSAGEKECGSAGKQEVGETLSHRVRAAYG